MDPTSLIVLGGLTVVIGYVGNLIFDRTKIPDIIWLVLFGVLMGPLLSFYDPALFSDFSSLFATVALMVILFDSGLNLDFYPFLKNAPKGMLFATANVAVTIITVGAFSVLVSGMIPGILPINGVEGLLLGAMLAGTCSATILTLLSKLRTKEETKIAVIMESIMNDTITIMAVVTLINLMKGTWTVSPIQGVVTSFCVGGVIGMMAGVMWLMLLNKLKGRPFDHILTLGAAFLVYVLSEAFTSPAGASAGLSSGSGVIAIFVFGLVLGNGRAFSRMLRFDKVFTVDKAMKTFQGEISFFIRSFFFVYLGLIFTFNQAYLIYGLALAAVIIIARFACVRGLTLPMHMEKPEANAIAVMGPRGIATAVIATTVASQLPKTSALGTNDMLSNVVLVVVMATVLFSTAATFFMSRKRAAG